MLLPSLEEWGADTLIIDYTSPNIHEYTCYEESVKVLDLYKTFNLKKHIVDAMHAQETKSKFDEVLETLLYDQREWELALNLKCCPNNEYKIQIYYRYKSIHDSYTGSYHLFNNDEYVSIDERGSDYDESSDISIHSDDYWSEPEWMKIETAEYDADDES